MRFRPCIDIHNGKVKQIVGGSLKDQQDYAVENFVSVKDAAYYAELYKDAGLSGGHIIMLNPTTSEYYEETKAQALNALNAWNGNMQIGGGITADLAEDFLKAGASHVIVTSYVFQNGVIHYENLEKLKQKVGKKHIVLDLSCRKKKDSYLIVTERWQNDTQEKLNFELLEKLSDYCDEFLVHAVDVEGKAGGIEEEVVSILGAWGKIPVTYAGGVHTMEDLTKLKNLGQNKVDVTVGSALDLFGGNLAFEELCRL